MNRYRCLSKPSNHYSPSPRVTATLGAFLQPLRRIQPLQHPPHLTAVLLRQRLDPLVGAGMSLCLVHIATQSDQHRPVLIVCGDGVFIRLALYDRLSDFFLLPLLHQFCPVITWTAVAAGLQLSVLKPEGETVSCDAGASTQTVDGEGR